MAPAPLKLKGKAAPPYTYHLLPGNESSLIKECFDRRPWWQPAEAAPSAGPSSRSVATGT